jgi:uncharacterized protein (TIGR02466 family)
MDSYVYFPSFIYRKEIPEWVEETLKHVEKHYMEAQKYTKEDSVVVQTMHMAKDPELTYLTSYFRDMGVSILKGQGYLTDDHEFYISGMWGQELKCNGGHTSHVHGDSQISGFYFLETPKGGSYPIFEDPRAGKLMTDLFSAQSNEVTPATQRVHFDNVIPGTMMMFNSWLPHSLMQSTVDAPTKFVHFTLGQKRRFM